MANNEKDERWCQKQILCYLEKQDDIKEVLEQDGLEIGEEIPVPYRISFIQKGEDYNMETYCYAQDICVYKRIPVEKFINANVSFSKTQKEVVYGNEEQEYSEEIKEEIIGNPFVILELKKGAVTTDTVLAYSQKMMSIKAVFPYAQYALVLIGRNAPRLIKHGYAFDRILQIEEKDLEGKGNEKIKEMIKEMLKESQERFEKL